MSPAHCDKNPSDFQGRGTAFIATKPRPTSRVALRQKTVRLPGIRQLDIATSRPTSRDSTWEHRKNGHFLNCGEQTNDVRVVASHGVQGLEHWEDGGHVATAATHSLSGETVPMTGCRWTRGDWADPHGRGPDHAHRKGSYWNAFPTTSSRPRPSLRCTTPAVEPMREMPPLLANQAHSTGLTRRRLTAGREGEGERHRDHHTVPGGPASQEPQHR
jgi:hypothetical protein